MVKILKNIWKSPIFGRFLIFFACFCWLYTFSWCRKLCSIKFYVELVSMEYFFLVLIVHKAATKAINIWNLCILILNTDSFVFWMFHWSNLRQTIIFFFLCWHTNLSANARTCILTVYLNNEATTWRISPAVI